MPAAGIDALRHPGSGPDGVVVEGTFSGIGRCVCVFLKGPQDHEGVEMGWRRILMYTKRLSRGRFREVLKKGDDGVRRLQWDDFYMLMRGLTPVKVMVENRFRMAVK